MPVEVETGRYELHKVPADKWKRIAKNSLWARDPDICNRFQAEASAPNSQCAVLFDNQRSKNPCCLAMSLQSDFRELAIEHPRSMPGLGVREGIRRLVMK